MEVTGGGGRRDVGMRRSVSLSRDDTRALGSG